MTSSRIVWNGLWPPRKKFLTKMQQKIGCEIDVLIDEVDADGAIGRSKADAPEGRRCGIPHDTLRTCTGQIARARVDEADEYDLWASLI